MLSIQLIRCANTGTVLDCMLLQFYMAIACILNFYSVSKISACPFVKVNYCESLNLKFLLIFKDLANNSIRKFKHTRILTLFKQYFLSIREKKNRKNVRSCKSAKINVCENNNVHSIFSSDNQKFPSEKRRFHMYLVLKLDQV